MNVVILHITDIHAGPGELRDEDLKQHIPDSERGKMLDRLTNYLRLLPNKPDYVVVTGDLTIRGNKQGLVDFRSWISDRISENILPDFIRIVVVPGNHDVVWGIKKKSGWHKERYSGFSEVIAKVFPHAYLPDCDPPLDPNELEIDVNSTSLIGGVSTRANLSEVEIVKSSPFILDLEKDILIFAFNSTIGCGVYLPPLPKIIENIDSLLNLYDNGDQQIKRKLKQIRDTYEQSLLIDAGLIGEQQLNYFSQLMNRFREKLGSKFSQLTKIAILHHHISHLWRQQFEVKTFESVLDSAQLKQRLIEYNFDLVLHGHKHTNHVAIDGSIIPVSSREQFNPICISSGGTVGGYPRLGDRQSFKLITFDEECRPRTTASIREVPLLDSANPWYTIEKESKIYSVPISSKLPELHDLKIVKDTLDTFMLEQYAPELNESEYLIITGAEFKFPAANPDIVGEASRYRSYCVVEKPNETIFYDIILAIQRLDFRQKARIYWMLTDVKGLEKRSSKKCKIVILVGNLEETHFFQGELKGEVRKSIEEIQNWFMPAFKSGLIEIRQHNFSQEDIERLTSKVTESLL